MSPKKCAICFPATTIRPLKEFLVPDDLHQHSRACARFIDAMIALAVAIGLLVIFLTMYTTVIERTRDIGVLKSLGADKRLHRAHIADGIRGHLSLFGIAAGVGISYGVRAAFLAGFPTLSILITPGWIVRLAPSR